MPAGRMTTGQGLVLGLIMGMGGTSLLVKVKSGNWFTFRFLHFIICFCLYPFKTENRQLLYLLEQSLALCRHLSVILPPSADNQKLAMCRLIIKLLMMLFFIQFVWQFPHFWSIAWVLDDDYKKAGFRLACLPRNEIKQVQ
jgi:protoheme IX farnesyltransferase